MRRLSPKELEARLRACRKEYESLKAAIRKVGFISQGSLITRFIACGKPNCRCAADPKARHGPYHQLSWKEAGKTVSRRLAPEHVGLYEEWIANRRALESLLDQMRTVSGKAAELVIRVATEPAPRGGLPRSRGDSRTRG